MEVGWVIHPAFGGKGYATQAASAILGTAFGSLGAHRVFARVDTQNHASVRLCAQLGMRREAYLVENDRNGNRWGSEYIYAILQQE